MGLLDFIYTGVIAHFLKKRLGGSGHHSAHDHHDHGHGHHGDHEDHEDYHHEDSWREDEALDHGDHDLDDVIYNKYIREDYDHDGEDYDHDGEDYDQDGWYGDKY